jgi:hypothetical protein
MIRMPMHNILWSSFINTGKQFVHNGGTFEAPGRNSRSVHPIFGREWRDLGSDSVPVDASLVGTIISRLFCETGIRSYTKCE